MVQSWRGRGVNLCLKILANLSFWGRFARILFESQGISHKSSRIRINKIPALENIASIKKSRPEKGRNFIFNKTILCLSFFIKQQLGICSICFICANHYKIHICQNAKASVTAKLRFQLIPKICSLVIQKFNACTTR